MNKKMMIAGVIGISSIAMVTSGFAAMANTSGYDAYKAAVKQTKTLQSLSVDAKADLQDNGKQLAGAAGSAKAVLAGEAGSGTVTIDSNGSQQTLNFYRQDNQTIVKSSASDVYTVEQEKQGKRHKEANKPDQMSKEVENVIDSLVGNLQDHITVDNKADGTKEVSLQLSDTQVPAVVNAVGALMVKKAAEEEKKHAQGTQEQQDPAEGFMLQNMKPNLPKLTQDIKIKAVNVKADIDASNYIKHQEAHITVTGKDSAGADHEVVLNLQADLSGLNSTTPDKVDLTGKNVKTVQHGHDGERKGQGKQQ